MKLLDKARILETKIHVNHENKKKIKQQRYKTFLQNPPRPLPDYKTLDQLRKKLLALAALSLTGTAIQILFFFNTIYWTPQPLLFGQEVTIEQFMMQMIKDLPTILGFLFIVCIVFFGAVDWTIHRRWGNHRTYINW